MRKLTEYPILSLAERDRRWALTRAEMKRRNLDCLVLIGWPAMWDFNICLLYTSPSPRDGLLSRMPSSA